MPWLAENSHSVSLALVFVLFDCLRYSRLHSKTNGVCYCTTTFAGIQAEEAVVRCLLLTLCWGPNESKTQRLYDTINSRALTIPQFPDLGNCP